MTMAREHPIRLVVVDDEPLLRRALRRLLERQGIEVVGEGADGSEGSRIATSVDADVILMDLRMPVLDGIQASAQIRSEGCTTPILLHTAYSDTALHDEAYAAGVTACVVKGSSPAEVSAAIREAAAAS